MSLINSKLLLNCYNRLFKIDTTHFLSVYAGLRVADCRPKKFDSGLRHLLFGSEAFIRGSDFFFLLKSVTNYYRNNRYNHTACLHAEASR